MAKFNIDEDGEGMWYVAFRFGGHEFETDYNMTKRVATNLGKKIAAILPDKVYVDVSSMPGRDR